MKKFYLAVLITCLSAGSLMQAKHRADTAGFSIILDGGPFHQRAFFVPPVNATYCNLYFDFKADPRAKRTVLAGSMADNTLQVYIDLPIHKVPGHFTFTEDDIPVYMGFTLTYVDKSGASSSYVPGKITVNINRYEAVGGFIGGDFSGELIHRGGNDKISVTGTFKVKRIRDKL